MLYQTQHSITTDKVTLEKGFNLNFPTHIHDSFEAILAKQGELSITVAGESYTISGNECVLVFPYQFHEIKTVSYAEHRILIFSPHLVRAFSKRIDGYVPESNKFQLDSFYIDKITNLEGERTTVESKGLLYSICAEFDKNAKYKESKRYKQNLLFRIFSFVSENYKNKCSLYELAEKINYNYVYLSKHFSKATGISYTEYVCHFRVNEACYLLLNTSNTVLDIAYECGFDCLRSFNRSFKSVTGITPSEYRKQGVAPEQG
ncbi:MAG: helix-turn-helix transcriptional regulator [Clostridia bacterium]|nr:helix-turn-helix transcriptional regulator [Clostridia bacterium]